MAIDIINLQGSFVFIDREDCEDCEGRIINISEQKDKFMIYN
jgi:hypothetical protein